MAADIEVGIRLTPPYGKSAPEGQMRHAIAAMQDWSVFQRSGDRFASRKRVKTKVRRLHNACTNLAPRRLNQR
jgi:hypothetical protein